MLNQYLQSTFYFNFEHPNIQSEIQEFKALESDQVKIEQWYIHVRDHWRYNPYVIVLDEAAFQASYIVQKEAAHCIDKAILYITGLRALNIPARLRLAKVSNHIAAENLINTLGSNEIAPHGLVEVFHQNQWTKCSPAFNKTLCERYKVDVLEYNGTKDSVMQEFNKHKDKFMEYLEDYGSFSDVPIEFIKSTFEANYPTLYKAYQKEQS